MCASFKIKFTIFQVKELRNQGDEVAREVMVRVVEGGEGAGSQRRDFEELIRLVRAAPFQITLGRSAVGCRGKRDTLKPMCTFGSSLLPRCLIIFQDSLQLSVTFPAWLRRSLGMRPFNMSSFDIQLSGVLTCSGDV